MKWSDLCLVPLAAVLAVCAACSFEQGSDGNPVSKSGEGRAETRAIRNTENIGFSGNAVADKIDHAMDASERRDQDLDNELDQYH